MRQFLKDWGVPIFLALGVLTLIFFVIRDGVIEDRIGNEVKDYCGPIIDKGYDPPSSGHKSHTDAQYWLVLQDEQCYKAIRLQVTPATYYANEKGKRICFSLSAYALRDYGNTNKLKHLK
jgi:hypothetical protein